MECLNALQQTDSSSKTGSRVVVLERGPMDDSVRYTCSVCGATLDLIQKLAGYRYRNTIFVRPCSNCIRGSSDAIRLSYDEGYQDGGRGFEHKYDPDFFAWWKDDDEDDD